jgi:hypothetical protein
VQKFGEPLTDTGLMTRRLAAIPLAAAAERPLDWKAARSQYRKDLFEDYLPFHESLWDKNMAVSIARSNRNGELISPEKTGTKAAARGSSRSSIPDASRISTRRGLTEVDRAQPAEGSEFWARDST